MRPTDVVARSVEELIAAYKNATAAHGAATLRGDHEQANENHDLVAAIYRELRTRGLEAQQALLPLFHHSDDAVRCWAASHGLEFAPDKAEGILRALATGGGVWGFNAKMTLKEWQKGTLSFP